MNVRKWNLRLRVPFLKRSFVDIFDFVDFTQVTSGRHGCCQGRTGLDDFKFFNHKYARRSRSQVAIFPMIYQYDANMISGLKTVLLLRSRPVKS